jgi:hypothetical protein
MTPPSPPCLILYHVPKTAGQSLSEWFQQQRKADGRRLRVAELYAALDKVTPAALEALSSNPDVLMGHWSPAPSHTNKPDTYPTLRSYLTAHNFTRRCSQWTVLREPRARVASVRVTRY